MSVHSDDKLYKFINFGSLSVLRHTFYVVDNSDKSETIKDHTYIIWFENSKKIFFSY
jgi:hypothetical protein